MNDQTAMPELPEEPVRRRYDRSDENMKFGECDQCGERRNLVGVDDEFVCGSCLDTNHLEEWRAYARQLRAAIQALAAAPAQEKTYTRAEVQKWRDDVAHAAADMAESALQAAGDWSWLVQNIRSLAASPAQAPATVGDEREAFEKWASDPVRAEKLPLDRWPTNGGYKDIRTYIAFYAWKAGREALSAPAQQVEAAQPEYFSLSALEKLRTALSRMGVAAPESLEELSATLEQNVLALCRAVDRRVEAVQAPVCGKSCDCLTQCGDVYEHTGKTKPGKQEWTDEMLAAAHEAMKLASPHVTLDTIVRVVNAGLATAPQPTHQQDQATGDAGKESEAHHYLFCSMCGAPNKPVGSR